MLKDNLSVKLNCRLGFLKSRDIQRSKLLGLSNDLMKKYQTECQIAKEYLKEKLEIGI